MIKLKSLILEYMNDQKLKILFHLIDSGPWTARKGRVEYKGHMYSAHVDGTRTYIRLTSTEKALKITVASLSDYRIMKPLTKNSYLKIW